MAVLVFHFLLMLQKLCFDFTASPQPPALQNGRLAKLFNKAELFVTPRNKPWLTCNWAVWT